MRVRHRCVVGPLIMCVGVLSGLIVTGLAGTFPAFAQGRPQPELIEMSLEELLALEITSAGKKDQLIGETAAAVYVITADDIRRSQATTVMELLRQVPGMHVARYGTGKWSIGIRGFIQEDANKLLVLMDGRSLYTPIYTGVEWKSQDTLLEDIDRIEVIRGPGASLWGANAVNGVINIITKDAAAHAGRCRHLSGRHARQRYRHGAVRRIAGRDGGLQVVLEVLQPTRAAGREWLHRMGRMGWRASGRPARLAADVAG